MAITFKVGDRDVVLGRLKTGVVEQILLRAAEAQGKPAHTVYSEQLELLAFGLKRHNPDLTADWLRENLEAGDEEALFAEMMKAAGTRTAAPGEGRSP